MQHKLHTDVGLRFPIKSQGTNLLANIRTGSLLLAPLIKIMTSPHFQYAHYGKPLRIKNKRFSVLNVLTLSVLN